MRRIVLALFLALFAASAAAADGRFLAVSDIHFTVLAHCDIADRTIACRQT
jgi:hypothetical protein